MYSVIINHRAWITVKLLMNFTIKEWLVLILQDEAGYLYMQIIYQLLNMQMKISC